MTQKWNLQDIRPAEPRKSRRPEMIERPQRAIPKLASEDEEDIGTIVIKDNKKTSRFNFTMAIVVVVVLLGGIFGLTVALSKTTLTIVPVSKEPNVNAEFTAYPDLRDGMLSYEIMSLDDTSEKQVKATGQQQVEEQARGFIEIVKTTAGSERLIKNTRFRSAEGLIFRIPESVVVPGAIKDAEGNSIPGTLKTEVFADNVGQEYNLPAGTRFDVPGFKESNLNELYNSIYAENREAFTGGFQGPRFTIDDNELSTARQALQMELRDKLLARIEAEKPADFIAFKDAVTFTYSELPAVRYGDDLVTIREQAVLQIPLFRHSNFASFIAKETVTTYLQEPVRIRNIEDLKFSYADPSTSSSNIANLPSLMFSIVGKPMIVWEYNVEQLQADLAGKPMTAISTVLSGHVGIKSANIKEKPFWKRDFPDEAEKINITEVLETN